MRYNNLEKFKKRFRPEWYEHGPVKIFTKEEIEAWTTKSNDALWCKITNAKSVRITDQVFLDNTALLQANTTYAEIMEGVNEGGVSDD